MTKSSLKYIALEIENCFELTLYLKRVAISYANLPIMFVCIVTNLQYIVKLSDVIQNS